MAKIMITNIDWDTDGDKKLKKTLPNKILVDSDDLGIENDEDTAFIEDVISDYLSDEYGFCHNGFDFRKTEETKA